MRRDHGSSILGKTGRGNVGKNQIPAGGSQQPAKTSGNKWGTRSPEEGAGLAHELVRAKKKG
jgi:hypothetical protein